MSRISVDDFKNRFLRRGRGVAREPSVEARVREILEDVSKRGDEAVHHYTEMFDGVRDLERHGLAVDEQQMRDALRSTPRELIEAMNLAVDNLRQFHRRESAGSWWMCHENGSFSGQRILPLKRAGIYVPGGRAPYPSSLLMGAVPAQVAGVEQLVVCSPPGRDGEVSRPVLAAARLLGIDRVYRAGGAQAIAAMAFGTGTVPQVDIICGPGNSYVTAAKRMVYGTVAIDSLAGPSELAVVADESADCVTVAADLVAQAEHDPEAGVFLFTTSECVFEGVAAEVSRQVESTGRQEIVRQALTLGSAAVIVDDEELIWRLVNKLAPEHLSIRTEDAAEKVGRVRSSGAVFVGDMSAVAFGDYTAGVNHVLPTSGTAHFASPLGVESFTKRINVLSVSREGFAALAQPTEVFAEAEGLDAHGRSVSLRRQQER